MTDYRQHNVHAEVVQPEPAKPRPEPTDDLREQIEREMREQGVSEWLTAANVARGFFAPLVAARDAEIEQLRVEAANTLANQARLKGLSVEDGAAVLELAPPRELVIAWVDAARKMLGDAENYSETRIDFPAVSMEIKAAGEFERYVFTVQRAGKLTPHEARKQAEAERDEACAQVAELTRQRDEAHESNTRLMQENQSRIHLEVTLRNDLVRLVLAVLGSWDPGRADELIAEAEQRITELRALAVVLPDSNELRRGWQTIIEAHLHMEAGLDMWELVTQLYDQLDHTATPAAQALEDGGDDD